MAALPPEYYARCTDTACTWEVTTGDENYRDALATQHTARYGHDATKTDYA